MSPKAPTPITDITNPLSSKAHELKQGVPVNWHYPEAPPSAPLAAAIRPSWKTLAKTSANPLEPDTDTPRKDLRGRCWFFADLVFPPDLQGIPLTGEEALFFVGGWAPFTLWLDGRELFRETHAWNATGPIAEPVIRTIEPGRTYRLVMAVGPMQIARLQGVRVEARVRRCMDMALNLETAVAQIRMAQALAQTPGEQQRVERAANKIDLEALGANKYDRVLASLRCMEKDLAFLSPRAKRINVHLIGHAHIDMDWLWTWPDTVHCIRRDVKAVVDMMDDYADLTFTCPQIPIYDVVRRMDPAVFAKVQKRVAEGRWECAAGTWVEGDLNMADGEAIARHMLYAADWTREHLGTKSTLLWEPDTFGHPGNMPQLARLGEMDTYFHLRCTPILDGQPVQTRNWKGVDGSSVVTFSQLYMGGLDPASLTDRVVAQIKQADRENVFALWGMGDHGGGLSRLHIDMLNRYRDKPLMPTFRFSTMGQLADAVRGEGRPLFENTGETTTTFEGCYTSHTDVKQANRRGENALLQAEALCAMAGLDRREALRDAWTPVLYNQFHDIMDGCAVGASYIDARRKGSKSVAAANKIAEEALSLLVRPAKQGSVITVINPLGFDRTEPVIAPLPADAKCLIDADGQIHPVQKSGTDFVFIARNIPAFSCKTYRVANRVPKGTSFADVATRHDAGQHGHPGFYVVDTNHAAAHICEASGVITSFYDKTLSRELIMQGDAAPRRDWANLRKDLAMNVFQVIDEEPGLGSAWMIRNIRREENLLAGARVQLVEAGPVFAKFQVHHHVRSSHIDEEILFYQDHPRVDFRATIDWHEKGNEKNGVPQLKVSFAAAMHTPRVRGEGPFCITERHTDGREFPIQKWADLSGDTFGFALYNDCKYGCDAPGSRLRLTLLRSTYNPDPNPESGHKHTVRFAFQSHGANHEAANLVRHGMAFNRPCATRMGRPSTESAMAAKSCNLQSIAHSLQSPTSDLSVPAGDSIVCTAIRRAEHSDALLVRFFETSGQPAQIQFSLRDGIRSATEVNFLENPIDRKGQSDKLRVRNGKVTASFRGFEVKTFLLT